MPSKLKVLMVDDEERFRTTTAKILTRKGYDTIVADSGEQALEMLDQNPDVVILDVKMGGIDGHETLDRIKKDKPGLPVIMLTGHGDLPSAQQALESGAFDYLAKPCDIELLSAKIADAVSQSGSKPYREKLASEVMLPISNYSSIDAGSTVKDAIKQIESTGNRQLSTDRLLDSRHRSVLVFENGNKLVGLLSPLDLIGAVRPGYMTAPKPSTADSLQYSAMFWVGLFTSRVKEIMDAPITKFMSDSPPTVDASANLMEVANMMSNGNARRLIVVEDGKIIGVIREQELFFEIARIISAG